MSEPQYAACFEDAPITLGPMIGSTYRRDPRLLGIVLSHYKAVAKLLSGVRAVAEIGCSDGFASRVVAQEVEWLSLFDFDARFIAVARDCAGDFARSIECHNIVSAPLPRRYDAVYMLDTLEHIAPVDEPAAMTNIVNSLHDHGVFIAGMPSLESQAYASAISRAGHVNCKTGDKLRADAQRYFRHVFLFTMHDEMVGLNFGPMAHHIMILCCEPLRNSVESGRGRVRGGAALADALMANVRQFDPESGKIVDLSYYAPGNDPEDVTNGNGHG